jgi:hypothetical protein
MTPDGRDYAFAWSSWARTVLKPEEWLAVLSRLPGMLARQTRGLTITRRSPPWPGRGPDDQRVGRAACTAGDSASLLACW